MAYTTPLYTHGWRNDFEGGWYKFVSGASENFFWPPPPLAYLEGHKTGLYTTVFITAIMTCKRLCLPAPNNYNSGLSDYYGYGYGYVESETERMPLLGFDHSILY